MSHFLYHIIEKSIHYIHCHGSSWEVRHCRRFSANTYGILNPISSAEPALGDCLESYESSDWNDAGYSVGSDNGSVKPPAALLSL